MADIEGSGRWISRRQILCLKYGSFVGHLLHCRCFIFPLIIITSIFLGIFVPSLDFYDRLWFAVPALLALFLLLLADCCVLTLADDHHRIPLPTIEFDHQHPSVQVLKEKLQQLYDARREHQEGAKNCYKNNLHAEAQQHKQLKGSTQQQINQLLIEIVDATLNTGTGTKLDLHQLHLEDAMKVFKMFLEKRQRNWNTESNTMTILIVTGYGSHGHVVKIKPEVEKFLKQNAFVYEMDYRIGGKGGLNRNPGRFRVTLRKNTRNEE